MSQNSEPPVSPPSVLPPSPYVGMRPYEAGEQAIFFGRDRDAALVRDKVFSARLTVLYGPSGIGKSSILRTLVMPRVVDDDARAIYFDDWRGADPTAALRARLIEEARRLGVPDPGAGAPTLTDLARLLIAADERTFVLILDQFEEFFTSPDHRLEPLRTELAALVRTPGLDARVLISLREEHLAALEPFRVQMVTLFQSTYRLEPLAGDNVREAIEAPAALFGVRYEAELVDRLVGDLRHEEGQPGSTEAGEEESPVDLPMLQLVCDELWKHVRALGESTISRGLYEGLGGRHGILEAYLRLVMPGRPRERELTATLMRHLAPPDGHKAPFSVTHLAALTELDAAQVQAELGRLAEARVVRTRHHEHANVRYELSHDSFIRIIAPWRDEVLADVRRRRRRRRGLQVGAVALVVALLAGAASWWKDRRELHDNTEALMLRDDLIKRSATGEATEEERRQLAQRFDHLASYLLWSRSGTARLERLRDLLMAYRHGLPHDYDVALSAGAFVAIPEVREAWPLVLRYSASRKLDPYTFTLQWQGLAKYLNEHWGIPVPLKLDLREEPTFPNRLVRLHGQDIEALEFDVGLHEADAFLSTARLPQPATEFFERFRNEWRLIPEAENGGPWWIVPRWSLPAWKALGVTAHDGNGLLAFLLAIRVQKHPERMLTPAAVEMILARVAKQYPQTVAEVRRVRGDRLARDLQEVIKQGRPLTSLATTLEILAQHPEGAPAEIAARVTAAAESLQPETPTVRKTARRKEVTQGDVAGTQSPRAIHPAYRDVEKWLAESEPEIRVSLGEKLYRMWLKEDRQFRPEFLYALERFGDDILRRLGLAVWPTVRAIGDPKVPPASFSLEILNRPPTHVDAVAIPADGSDTLDRVIRHMTTSVEAARVHFVTAGRLHDVLGRTDKRIAQWLNERYSLTDLKTLLRGVVRPSDEEVDARMKGAADVPPTERRGIPHEQALRDAPWLLASLVFWTTAHGDSVSDLVQGLRATQRARVAAVTATAGAKADVAPQVERGVRALFDARITDAESAFAAALQANKRVAVAQFLAAYPLELRRARLRESKAWCAGRVSWRKSGSEENRAAGNAAARIDIEDLLGSADGEMDTATGRRLRLCLLADYPERYRQERRRLTADVIKRYGEPPTWPADEAGWFGVRLLADFDVLTDDSATMANAVAFLRSAVARADDSQARDRMNEILNVCSRRGPRRWCWGVVHDIGEARRDPWIAVSLASELVRHEVAADVQRGLEWAARSLALSRGDASQSRASLDVVAHAEFSRAEGLLRLADLGAGGDLSEAERLLRRLVEVPRLRSGPTTALARVLRFTGRGDEARVLLDASWKRVSDDPALLAERLHEALETADSERVARIAQDALVKVRGHRDGCRGQQDFCFIAALGLLITESAPWELVSREFLATSHPNVPYIAMMLYSRMTGTHKDEAREVIEKLWADANPASWPARLRHGDASAWREMLIGYATGKVGAEKIFPELEDDRRFAVSDLRHVPLVRAGMLSEAYFYDALLGEARGDQARVRAGLSRVLERKTRVYLEYSMAKYLLGRSSGGL